VRWLVETIAGSFKHVELRVKGHARSLVMTRLEEQLGAPVGGEGAFDVWQSEVSTTSLGLMEDVIASKVRGGSSEEPTLGYVFRFGLFRKPPAIEKHVPRSSLQCNAIATLLVH
jgi:hypothetical protein